MSYRADQDAARARVDAIERALAEATAEALELRRELDEARTALAATRAELAELRKVTGVKAPAAPAVPKAAPVKRNINVKQMLSMAKLAIQTNKFERALELCRELIEHGEESKDLCRADVYLMMGRIMLEKKQPNQARELFEAGLVLEPHHKELRRVQDDLGGKR